MSEVNNTQLNNQNVSSSWDISLNNNLVNEVISHLQGYSHVDLNDTYNILSAPFASSYLNKGSVIGGGYKIGAVELYRNLPYKNKSLILDEMTLTHLNNESKAHLYFTNGIYATSKAKVIEEANRFAQNNNCDEVRFTDNGKDYSMFEAEFDFFYHGHKRFTRIIKIDDKNIIECKKENLRGFICYDVDIDNVDYKKANNLCGDIEAGENLGITSNDKVSSIVPMTPSDKAKGWQEGTHGYARVQQMGEKTAWTFGDEHYANANHGQIPGDPTTVGNNNSTPLAQTIGIFSGNTLSASWSGAGGGLDLNSRNILFKEKPEKITDENYPNPKEPDYEKIPDEPEYTPVPDAIPEPTAPVAPTLNTITEPVAPVAPGEAPTEPVKPEDVDVSRTIHYHRAYRLKPVTTKWVDEEGNELKTPVTDDTTKEHGDITGYSFVRSDEDESENVTHVFKQHTTSWVDIDTNESLKNTEKGIKEHGDIEKYYFVESETKPTGDVVHKFRAVTTSYVTEKGEEVFPTEKGTHKEKAHKDYSYKRTEVDKHGNTKHIYVKFNTEYMDEDKNRIANREEGAKDPKEIPGYEYIRSIPDIENTLITHIYRQVTTSWVEEGGKTLKPTDKGVQEHGEFSGYTYIKTETDAHGNIVHTFEKNGSVPTGVEDTSLISLITGSLSALGIIILNKKKREG